MGLLNDFSPGGIAIDISVTDATFSQPVGVLVTGAGNVKLDTSDGDTLTVGAVAGQTLPWSARKVYKIGTTATGMFSVRLP